MNAPDALEAPPAELLNTDALALARSILATLSPLVAYALCASLAVFFERVLRELEAIDAPGFDGARALATLDGARAALEALARREGCARHLDALCASLTGVTCEVIYSTAGHTRAVDGRTLAREGLDALDVLFPGEGVSL